MVSLVGPAASSWAIEATSEGEGELAAISTRADSRARCLLGLDSVTTSPGASEEGKRGIRRRRAGDNRWARLMGELARPLADSGGPRARGERARSRKVPRSVVLALGRALIRAGRDGARVGGADRWQRRRGGRDSRGRRTAPRRSGGPPNRGGIASSPHAAGALQRTCNAIPFVLGQRKYSAGRERLEGAGGALVAEMRGLVAYRRGAFEAGLASCGRALAETRDADECARLEATRGMLEHARGDAEASLLAFGHAAELATRAGAIVEEATYLTGEAAAATDAGAIDRALGSATRAALLWERLGRGADAGRAWLSRAGALFGGGGTARRGRSGEAKRFGARPAGDRARRRLPASPSVTTVPAAMRASREAIRPTGRCECGEEDVRARGGAASSVGHWTRWMWRASPISIASPRRSARRPAGSGGARAQRRFSGSSWSGDRKS